MLDWLWDRVCVLSLEEWGERQDLLTSSEKEEVLTMRIEKRTREKTAGKVAAKFALARKLGLMNPGTEFFQAHSFLSPDGPPRHVPQSGPVFRVSITHSRYLAGAVLDESPVGLDLEWIRPIEPGARKFFMNEAERLWCEELEAELGDDPRIVLSWFCGKEAGLKLHEIGLAGVSRLQIPKSLHRNRTARVEFEGIGQEIHLLEHKGHIAALSVLS